jgi:hypothetical protein
VTRSIVGQLAFKDLYLSRWIVVGAIVAGLASLAMTPFDPVAFYVGSISFLCVLIVLNIFLVLSGVMQEKKDHVRLFVLSLPISTAQYTAAKMAANFTAFFFPWVVLTVASLFVIGMTDIPDGLMPIVLAVATYLLTYYCVLLGVSIASESQFWPGAVILAGNVSLNFVIAGLFRMRSVGVHASGDTAMWGRDVLAVLGIELFVAALALILAFAHHSRRKDFV